MIDRINTMPTDNSKYFLNTYKVSSEKSFSSNQNNALVSHSDLSNKKKAFVFGTSILGMVPLMALYAKKAGFSLNPAKILKTPIKEWAIFKYKPLDKIIEFDDPIKIVSLAGASVLGGLAGGAVVDKKNIKAKKKEALNQFLGDVLVPVMCVWAGAKCYKAFENPIQKIMPKISKDTKIAKIFNTISENIPKTIATLAPLALGIIAGNKVSNEINEKLYHKKVDRNIRITDFAPHVDDLCMSLSMVNSGSTLGSAIGRVIPAALIVPGYETGTATEEA